MKRIIIFYLAFFLSLISVPLSSIAENYPEVLFENSILPTSYSGSEVQYQGNSWIRNIRNSLPVSDSVFFTPNNALSLNYISSAQGHWHADVFYPEKYQVSRNGVLILKLYVESKTTINELPAFQLIQTDSLISEPILLEGYISDFKENTWLSIEVPISKIRGLNDNPEITAIRFLQHGMDTKEHQIYIDQIEILPSRTPSNKLTSAAVLKSVLPFERHIDVSWQLPLTPSIRYIKIYRSENNKDFQPVAIRPIFATKYSDVISEVGKTYYYKIAWLDFQYRESPYSSVKETKTKILSSDELLNMVQHANIEYYIDGMEFNSGMHQFRRARNDAIVSPKLTGIGIMALISGVNQKIIPRNVFVDRLNKISSFLTSAESIHGAFPALIDGRTGKGVFSDPYNPVVDLDGTSYLIQGLLVAKQFLNPQDPTEATIRNKITSISKAVEWNKFIQPQSPFLYTDWSVNTEFSQAKPLMGREALSTYLIAWASPNYNIPFNDSIAIVKNLSEEIHYGLPLTIGTTDDPLDSLLTAFAVFDPRDKHDKGANYYNELHNLILIKYRKSLEEGSLPDGLGSNLTVDSKGWTDPSSIVSAYPFTPHLALRNLMEVYRKYPTLFWSEYGFRTINLKENKLSLNTQGIRFGTEAIMIENGKTDLIWKLFAQDQDINRIVNALFEADSTSLN
ncbi:glucoamylase family protein [Albibacterium sp.]|uniref:glucoamylase family protein n=1 Tax=Albibacterium sp. TaxID=2952885 RepID=UPI002BF78368|nr:glucoamylase family protein [Albibacterium sp.]HUH18355.1 glucoamylase family protein [Albibacterium sp.]